MEGHETSSADKPASPGDCVRRLADRRDDVRRALNGDALRVLLDYRDRGSSFGVLLTRDGHVLRVPDDGDLRPHVEVRGTDDEVRAFLLGELGLYDAVVSRVVVLRIETDEVGRYRALRDLVADTLG